MKSSAKVIMAGVLGLAVGVGSSQLLQAQQQMKRDVVQHADLTGSSTTEVYMTVIEAPPGSNFAPHIHHGDEFTYVMQGSAEIEVAGQGTKTFKAGDSIHVNRETVHGGKVTGDAPLKLLAVHIVDKGKPLAEAAK